MEMTKTKGSVVYPAVQKALRKLGEDVALARRSRGISTSDFADQMGVSRATLNRLEKGDPGCSANTLAMACLSLGLLERLQNLLDQQFDQIGLMQMTDRLPKRLKNKRVVGRVAESDKDDGNGEFW